MESQISVDDDQYHNDEGMYLGDHNESKYIMRFKQV